jgi:hypothetical protein
MDLAKLLSQDSALERRYRYFPLFRTILTVTAVFLMPLLMHADTGGTVSFLDGSANPTFTDTTGRAAGSCQNYSCIIDITAPTGYTWSGALLVDVWRNAGTTNVRDALCGGIYGFSGECTFSSNMVTLQFVAEGASALGSFSAGMELENGIANAAGNIYWMNSDGEQITDSLKISAISAPEPSSLVVLAGFLALGLVMICRGRVAGSIASRDRKLSARP